MLRRDGADSCATDTCEANVRSDSSAGILHSAARLSRVLTGQSELVLDSQVPTRDELAQDGSQDIDELGLYLHIPFCRQICPYCPYNKELYSSEAAERYAAAVTQEIDFYADIVGQPSGDVLVHRRGYPDHHAETWLGRDTGPRA